MLKGAHGPQYPLGVYGLVCIYIYIYLFFFFFFGWGGGVEGGVYLFCIFFHCGVGRSLNPQVSLNPKP